MCLKREKEKRKEEKREKKDKRVSEQRERERESRPPLGLSGPGRLTVKGGPALSKGSVGIRRAGGRGLS